MKTVLILFFLAVCTSLYSQDFVDKDVPAKGDLVLAVNANNSESFYFAYEIKLNKGKLILQQPQGSSIGTFEINNVDNPVLYFFKIEGNINSPILLHNPTNDPIKVQYRFAGIVR